MQKVIYFLGRIWISGVSVTSQGGPNDVLGPVKESQERIHLFYF